MRGYRPALTAVAAAWAVVSVGARDAAALTLTDLGTVYALEVSNIVGNSADVTFSADTSGFVQNPSKPVDFIQAVNWSLPVTILTAQLTGAPGDEALWETAFSNLNNGGCGAADKTQKICSEDAPTLTEAALGGTLVWEYEITFDGVLDPNDLTGSHIGAKYNNAAGRVNGIITSVEAPAVPEPRAALAFAMGLAVVAGALRRRTA
jgi:hypothetical protein